MENGFEWPGLLWTLVLAQHPDQHRPKDPVLLAVDQESRRLRIGGTIGSTQSGEAIEMVPSVDIHRVAFITGSAKDQSDTGWLLAHFLNQDGVRGNAPSLRQHPSRVAGGLLNWDGISAGMRAPDVGLNDGYQLVDDSRAHAGRDPDADLERGSILSGGVVAPGLIQDELVRSQHPFDGVDQPVPIHGPMYLGPQQPALSQVLRGGGVPVAEQEDREQIDMSSLRHGA
jgi:hypothetical protein